MKHSTAVQLYEELKDWVSINYLSRQLKQSYQSIHQHIKRLKPILRVKRSELKFKMMMFKLNRDTSLMDFLDQINK